jgi:hypothetical protein
MGSGSSATGAGGGEDSGSPCEDAWTFDEDVLSRFSWDVREAINEYVRYAREHRIIERKSMRRR